MSSRLILKRFIEPHIAYAGKRAGCERLDPGRGRSFHDPQLSDCETRNQPKISQITPKPSSRSPHMMEDILEVLLKPSSQLANGNVWDPVTIARQLAASLQWRLQMS
ncbi:hypothetical protein NPIL_223771 [Nephila pilipes]|uniref:Uncharacterized protein n=1 Tax=Nephila pilipes TaxID=299642 RepID=A0A8X6TA53_NEPPI|nr:hypothetical protein NPIL_223771 [Nephila pilipes]